MDIRKFFGPNSAASKKTPDPPKSKTAEKKEGLSRKTTKPTVSPAKREKKKQPAKSPKKKSPAPSKNKQPILDDDDDEAVIVEEYSDEEVIKSSQKSVRGGKKLNGFGKKTDSLVEKDNKSSDKISKHSKVDKNTSKQQKNKAKHQVSDDEDDVIEIESVKSSDSKDSRSSSQKRKKSDRTGKDGSESESKGGRQDKKEENTNSQTRTSPRKRKSEEKAKKENHKRKHVSSDDEDFEKGHKEPTEADESESEDVITSRRRRSKKISKASKRAARALDSESDEDPLPKEKSKRRKKEPVCFVSDSDEEKKTTAMDKFVIHNAKKPSEDKRKINTDKNKAVEGKAVSVADFFGSDTAARSDRTTAVAKRKHDEVEKKEEIDLTFDEELHDDEDFLKTLDQLDEPNIKKVKVVDNNEDDKADKEQGKGSLASKLAGKMKNTTQDNKKDNKACDTNGNVMNKSPAKTPEKKESPEKKNSPVKAKTSAKKGKLYSMEVTRTKPETVVVDPRKPKEKEEVTPKKGEATPTGKGSSSGKKTEVDPSDDGFGSKTVGGFRAFKARSGPLALGSKEIPEGAENCLEGLTFVITGVLDSIERDDAKSLVEKHGGKVTGSISGKTSYVVVGREAGESKLAKARSLKVKQLEEDDLFELIKTLPGKTSKYEIQAKEQLKKEASVKAAQEKAAAAASKKLESFRSPKDTRNDNSTTSSPTKKKSLFTQIKDSSESGGSASSVPSPKTSKLLEQSQSPSKKKPAAEGETLLWVDKHKPTSLKQIIGQQGDKSNAKKLLNWLNSWHTNVIVKKLKPAGNFFNKGDGAGCRAALLSGPPGIGKTTSATLVCKEAGFSYVELNASDTRSKRSLKEVVAESLNNQTLVDYMGDHSGPPTGQSHCLIMDEVDGMAGNEDRGGLQELVQLIKGTKIPIICICNDRNSMKMRTLSNYCLDLRFQRPRVEQIKGAMMSIAFKEGLKLPPAALNEIILASNHDIRQVIHNMSVWSATDKSLTFEQVKEDSQKAQKDIKLGPFDVCRKVFVIDDETRKMSLHDKSDLFFHDYSFGPLFVHENYPNVIPANAKGNHSKHLSCLARTIDSICDGDHVDKLIRREGNWNLLPLQAMFSSVIPGEVMRGSLPQMAAFPQWLGKFSSTNKTHRILQELGTHMGLQISCDKRGLGLDYLPALRTRLTSSLVSKGSEGVPEVIRVMDDYDIIKEDFDNILEITKWPNSVDPMAKLDTKTKAAFTRQYNKEIHMTPYATGVVSKKRKGRGAPMDESDFPTEEGEGGEAVVAESEDEEDEDIEADTMIKTKKPTGKGKGSSQQSTSSKGKGGKAAGAKGKK